jgi:hypothetical protein
VDYLDLNQQIKTHLPSSFNELNGTLCGFSIISIIVYHESSPAGMGHLNRMVMEITTPCSRSQWLCICDRTLATGR